MNPWSYALHRWTTPSGRRQKWESWMIPRGLGTSGSLSKTAINAKQYYKVSISHVYISKVKGFTHVIRRIIYVRANSWKKRAHSQSRKDVPDTLNILTPTLSRGSPTHKKYLQPADIGWPTGNGKKLSSTQAQLGQTTCLVVASFLSISCKPSNVRRL